MKSVRSKLALSSNSIVLPERDLIDRMRAGNTDLFNDPDSPYHLEENEIIVDLFCGAGGTSQGILQALGESPAFAVNHNPDAIGVHDANHPETIHLESDVFAAAPSDHVPDGKSIGLLCASPSCVSFSRAKGGKPLDREIRDQAWVVANWCEHPNPRFNPRVVVVENVHEFLSWAPLTSDDRIDKRYIDKNGLGSTFKEWRGRLINAGYAVEYKLLNAADYGVPTKRKRLLIVARRDELPIRFPVPTHGPRNSPAVLSGKLLPYVAASTAIDFGIQCNPVFMYPEDAKKVGAKRPLADNTLKRIAAGVERYVIEADDPYIVSYYGPKSGEHWRGQCLNEPLPTQTTENRFAIVNPVVTPLTHAGPGRFYTANDQLPTLTAAHRGELAVISPICVSNDNNFVSGNDVILDQDIGNKADGVAATFRAGTSEATATATANTTVFGSSFEAPFLAGAGGGEYVVKPQPIDVPINTLTCDNRSSIIMPTLVRVAHGSIDRHGKKRGRGDHDIQEPLPTQSTSNEFAVVEPFMVTTGYGERRGQAPRIHSLDDPMNTVVACGMKHALVQPGMTSVPHIELAAVHFGQDNHMDVGRSAHDPLSTLTLTPHQTVIKTGLAPQDRPQLVAAHMAQNNAENVGHAMVDPMSTMTTSVSHQSVVTSHMLTLRQNGFGQSMDDPLPTLCAAGNHHGEVRACFVKYYSEGGQWQDAGEPLDTLTTKPRFAIVQVPVEELGLTEEQRYEAWWIARFLEVYGTKTQGNPNTAHLDGPRPSIVGRPGAVLWTIQMRMLVAKEAFAASSFPAGYNFEKRADGKAVSKTTQMQLVGNAVPPGLAQAIIGANVKPRRSIANRMPLDLENAA